MTVWRHTLATALAVVACTRRGAPHTQRTYGLASADVVVTVGSSPVRDAAVVPRSSLVIRREHGRACRSDDDCGDGRCFNASLEAQYSRVMRDCGDARAWRDAHVRDTCVEPACTRDEACPTGQRCATLPMVPFPQRMCLPAGCRSHAECVRDGALGQCVAYLAGRPCEHGGWNCVYSDDPCSPVTPTRRCQPSHGVITYCVPVAGRFRCVAEQP